MIKILLAIAFVKSVTVGNLFIWRNSESLTPINRNCQLKIKGHFVNYIMLLFWTISKSYKPNHLNFQVFIYFIIFPNIFKSYKGIFGKIVSWIRLYSKLKFPINKTLENENGRWIQIYFRYVIFKAHNKSSKTQLGLVMKRCQLTSSGCQYSCLSSPSMSFIILLPNKLHSLTWKSATKK